MGRRTQPDSVAGRVRDAVVSAAPQRFWGVADFAGLDSSLVDKALARLWHADELVQVRRGLYWRGLRRSWGMTRPDLDRVVDRIAGRRGVGPAGLSAANELGLSTQVPGTDVVAVPGPAPRPLGAVRFVSRPARTARRDAGLGSTEVAFLEVLDAWLDVVDGDAQDAAEQLRRMVVEGAVDGRRLASGARTESAGCRERLRHVLISAGRADLADGVPPATSRVTRDRALAGLVAA